MLYSQFPNISKIAVFRALALGDFLFALPALAALHASYPQAEIVYLGREWHTSFVPGRLPGAHRVLAIPSARTKEQIEQGLVVDPDQEARVLHVLRAERFDLALQMHGAGERSNAFVSSLGARFSVGLKSQRAPALERWTPYVYYQNEVVRMLAVAALTGATSGIDLTPRLPVLESDLLAAAAVLDALSGPFVVFHPGSTDPRRCWEPEHFAAVGDACAALGLRVVLTGTAMEAERMRAVEAAMRAPVLNLCDRLSLPGLVGLLSRARLFVGNDSGPLHLALAAGAPAVGLFWSEYTLNSMPLERERFRPLIAWRRTCPRCGMLCDKAELDRPSGPCTHEVSFIDEISAAQVIAEVQALLETTAS